MVACTAYSPFLMLHGIPQRMLTILVRSVRSQETLRWLSSFMALGYLNLSGNPIPLEGLWPLARVHILELCLTSGRRSTEERREILRLLPNVWVLDDEYVTAQERCSADGLQDVNHRQDLLDTSNDHPLAWNDHNPVRNFGKSLREDSHGGKDHHVDSSEGKLKQQKIATCGLSYRSPEGQGNRAREFYENVVWTLPCR